MIWISDNAEDEEAFDLLFCIAFEMMDAQWLAMHASYMEFNVLLSPLQIHCHIYILKTIAPLEFQTTKLFYPDILISTVYFFLFHFFFGDWTEKWCSTDLCWSHLRHTSLWKDL